MNRIKEIRKIKKLSLEEVALRCDPQTTPKQIQRLEKEERQLTTTWIKRLSSALGVTPGEIVPDLNYEQDELTVLISRLEEEDKKATEDFVNYLLQKKDKKP